MSVVTKQMNLCALFLLLTIYPIVLFFDVSLAADNIEANLIEYKSLCDVEPQNRPSAIFFQKGHFEIASCKQIEERHGKPKAISVNYYNRGTNNVTISIDGLKGVVLKGKNKKDIFSIGIYIKMSPPMAQYPNNYVVIMENAMTFEIKPNTRGEIIFLFQDAGPGDLLQIKSLPPLSVQKMSSKKDVSEGSLGTKPERGKSFPSYKSILKGENEVRIKNPNEFNVNIGLRSGGGGKDFSIAADSVSSVFVPNGDYEIYFKYSNDPDALYRGDNFSLKDNGIEIQIIKVSHGNYQIRKIK